MSAYLSTNLSVTSKTSNPSQASQSKLPAVAGLLAYIFFGSGCCMISIFLFYYPNVLSIYLISFVVITFGSIPFLLYVEETPQWLHKNDRVEDFLSSMISIARKNGKNIEKK